MKHLRASMLRLREWTAAISTIWAPDFSHLKKCLLERKGRDLWTEKEVETLVDSFIIHKVSYLLINVVIH